MATPVKKAAVKKPARRATPKAAPKTEVKHDLSQYIPSMTEYDEFVSRDLPGGMSDIDTLRYARRTNQNVILFGPTGPGKTSLIRAFCAIEQLPLATINCNGALEPSTVYGGPAQNVQTGLIEYVEAPLLKIIRFGGVVYLDEINFAPPKVAAGFHSMLDSRREVTLLEKMGEVVKLSEQTSVFAAYNPEYVGTRPLNPAFKNRFSIKIRYGYDRTVEEQLVFGTALLDLADKLRDAYDSGELETPVSTNMLIEFEQVAVGTNYEFAVDNFLNAFAEDERPSVEETFVVHSDQIKTETAEILTLSATD